MGKAGDPAQFAANGWVLDVSDRFPEEDQQQFLDGPVQSLIYQDKIYGVPWFTDAGMLYYRQDLLDQSGISEPPATWADLKEMATQVAQENDMNNGFVFQGANYEGGTVNGLEYIWTHGGNATDPNNPDRVVIDSLEAAAGLETQRSMVADDIAPQAVSTYKETETDPAFRVVAEAGETLDVRLDLRPAPSGTGVSSMVVQKTRYRSLDRRAQGETLRTAGVGRNVGLLQLETGLLL